jgi:uncharacterized delta-60 repeat protein
VGGRQYAADGRFAFFSAAGDRLYVLVRAELGTPLADNFGLVRYNANGTVDTSFGLEGNGTVTTDFFSTEDATSYDKLNALLIQPNGKILAVGTRYLSSTVPTATSLAMARYNASGTLDTSFSGDGLQVISAIGGGNAVASAPGGKTVIAGEFGPKAAVPRFGSDYAATASISGTLYNDLNGNGKRDTGEPALSAWQVYVDSNNDGVYTPGEAVANSNSSGYYKISGLVPGTYRIREVRLNGWNRTQPAGVYPLGYYDVTLSVGQAVIAKNFGNKKAV